MEIIYTATKCPNKECPGYGEDHRLMHSLIIFDKNTPADTCGNTRMETNANIIPGRTVMPGGRIPAARRMYDVCTKCGQEFCVRIDKGHLTIPISQNQQPTFI